MVALAKTSSVTIKHFGVAHGKMLQQPLVAAAHKHRVQLQAALHCFLHQVQAFDGDMGAFVRHAPARRAAL